MCLLQKVNGENTLQIKENVMAWTQRNGFLNNQTMLMNVPAAVGRGRGILKQLSNLVIRAFTGLVRIGKGCRGCWSKGPDQKCPSEQDSSEIIWLPFFLFSKPNISRQLPIPSQLFLSLPFSIKLSILKSFFILKMILKCVRKL